MSFKSTRFPYFQTFCKSRFSKDLGSEIYSIAVNILNDLRNEYNQENSKAVRWHIESNILPTIAIYKAMQSKGLDAYEITAEVLRVACVKDKNRNRVIGILPFGYNLFKMFFKKIVMKQYPKDGWDIEWINYDEKELYFNMNSCIYHEYTNKYGCTELCPIFCANDDITLSGFSPSIIFERHKTIAKGDEICDFHFKNSKFND